MLPGPDQIIECPHCHALARYGTLISGNTFGARLWTDGKQLAPMLPEVPPFTRCPACQAFYWVEDAPEVGQLNRWGDIKPGTPQAWADAPEVQEPSPEEYQEVLARGRPDGLTGERWEHLLIRAWHRYNDAYRELPAGTGAPALPEPIRTNMVTLTSVLTGESPSDHLLRAELQRQLGNMTQARRELQNVHDAPELVSQMLHLIEAGDATVREFQWE
ncbi:hypothetical protein ACFOPQ_01695 [Deinococcus antarcticus]|uniref:CpXC motif protein n=1 Tax=Deinococcus antarcticus TaxID=1298767 RepID=A0ABV8A5P7_9DEIO